MKTITINLYEFSELSDKAKEKAIEKLYDINVGYDWWCNVYEDAENAGIKIKAFDVYRNYIELYIEDPEETGRLIKENHGKECSTYKAIEAIDNPNFYINVLRYPYLEMLKQEYEYRTSEEAIIETILCNEFTFTEDGTMDNRL